MWFWWMYTCLEPCLPKVCCIVHLMWNAHTVSSHSCYTCLEPVVLKACVWLQFSAIWSLGQREKHLLAWLLSGVFSCECALAWNLVFPKACCIVHSCTVFYTRLEPVFLKSCVWWIWFYPCPLMWCEILTQWVVTAVILAWTWLSLKLVSQ